MRLKRVYISKTGQEVPNVINWYRSFTHHWIEKGKVTSPQTIHSSYLSITYTKPNLSQSILLENGYFNGGCDRIQTPFFSTSTNTKHNGRIFTRYPVNAYGTLNAMAGFSLVTRSTLQKMAYSIESVRVL